MDVLMELRVPMGWAVTYNKFYDVDPLLNEEGEIENWGCFTQDLMQIVRMDVIDGEWGVSTEAKILIDLGWYPDGDAEGEYGLRVVLNPDWRVLLNFRSKDRFKVKEELEELLLEDIFIHPFQNSRRPINVDAEADRFRSCFLENYEIPEKDASVCRYIDPRESDI